MDWIWKMIIKTWYRDIIFIMVTSPPNNWKSAYLTNSKQEFMKLKVSQLKVLYSKLNLSGKKYTTKANYIIME